ncbi:diguanylate cyclase [Acanthopleuribacter pedis]|uniref:diguanylate cyclase n=1 Tax=Acanthopleuribacter pedis TaxID=442870 RepID=A0A8J7QCZ5_9BACT|nr:diguanylate cyclase [Acanthopleuribacter pedis]MBO1321849.1 diguanylate cyclase [Acanthopleuribacter pedis]
MIRADRKQRILVVDDMPANIKILGQAIRGRHEVSVATNGRQALNLAFNDPPDLILLDILMPDMDGYETCRRLKDDSRTKDIPIIFVTSKDELEDETLGLELGAVDYITKPFHLPIVLARINTHLRLKLQSDLLEELAKIDALTEIPNRRQFEERLAFEWQRSQRGGHPIGLIMIDIDEFKKYNDFYGHAQGDECLKAVAHCLAREIPRSQDLVARYGGEEFVLVLPDTDVDGTVAVGRRLCQAVDAMNLPHEKSSVVDHVTISVGAAAAIAVAGQSSTELLLLADECLYRAKEGGRNTVWSMVGGPHKDAPP